MWADNPSLFLILSARTPFYPISHGINRRQFHLYVRNIRFRMQIDMFFSVRQPLQLASLFVLVGCSLLSGVNHAPAANVETPQSPQATGTPAVENLKKTTKTAPAKAVQKVEQTKPVKTVVETAKKTPGKKPDKKTNAKQPAKKVVYKRSGICTDLDKLARRYKLPPLFFARLIWQESGFNPYAVSPVGAQGIAQFMPETALIWGLDDPFEPGQALLKSAQYLSWLHRKLGNLGLAAAGYNAGSERVRGWVNGTRTMPLETRNYVYSITGYTVEEWAQDNIKFVGLQARGRMSTTACKQLAIALRNERPHLARASLKLHDNILKPSKRFNRKNMRVARKKGHTRAAYRRRRHKSKRLRRRLPHMPWGVQLAGSFSRSAAMRKFRLIKRKYARIIGSKRIVFKSSRQGGRGRRIFHRVRIGTKSRPVAQAICKRLRSAGGSCVVMKN